MAFESELVVREVGLHQWEVTEDLVYRGREDLFRVGTGFVTNFASVPRLLRWLIPKYGRYNKATVLHDYLCEQANLGNFDRSDADGIFRRCLREAGVAYVRRWLMWAGVRLGGKLAGASTGEFALVTFIAFIALVPVIVGLVTAQLLVWVYQLFELLVYVLRALMMWILRRPPLPDPAPMPSILGAG